VRGINPKFSSILIVYYVNYATALIGMRIVGVFMKNYDFAKTGYILHELATASSWRVFMASWVLG
jgi:hypothetical protein